MLTGKAKTDYQREYMRRYRAKQSVRPVRPVRPHVRPEPSKIELDAEGNVIPGY